MEGLTTDNVIVDLVPLHYGMKAKNPLDFIKFYSKRNMNSEYYKMPVVATAGKPLTDVLQKLPRPELATFPNLCPAASARSC